MSFVPVYPQIFNIVSFEFGPSTDPLCVRPTTLHGRISCGLSGRLIRDFATLFVPSRQQGVSTAANSERALPASSSSLMWLRVALTFHFLTMLSTTTSQQSQSCLSTEQAVLPVLVGFLPLAAPACSFCPMLTCSSDSFAGRRALSLSYTPSQVHRKGMSFIFAMLSHQGYRSKFVISATCNVSKGGAYLSLS